MDDHAFLYADEKFTVTPQIARIGPAFIPVHAMSSFRIDLDLSKTSLYASLS